MPYIVIVFGASGSGKTTLMEQLMLAGGQYSIHIKATNRPARQYDDIEIQCVESVNPDAYDYIYSTYGYSYGIQRIQIEKAVVHNRHHFIICNDISIIRAVKRDYGTRVKVVFHHFDAPRKTLLLIQQSRGIGDDEVELRLAKIESLYKTYAENWNLFDAVLPNHYGDEPPDLRSKMEALLEQWARSDQESPALLLKRLESFAEGIETRLSAKWPSRVSAIEPGYAFIIMAMPKDDFLSQDVHRTIKRVCRDFGLKAERVDDIQFTGQITQKIKSSIALAEFVIADITYGRPNVYYEVGFADAFDKSLLLLAREGTEVHFDLAGEKILFYRNMAELEDLLIGALSSIRNQKGVAQPGKAG